MKSDPITAAEPRTIVLWSNTIDIEKRLRMGVSVYQVS